MPAPTIRWRKVMPYVPPDEALDRSLADLDATAARMGEPPWRIAIIGTPGLRVVLIRWPAGFATVPHVHPHADEIFQVIGGRARFAIGDADEIEARPGDLVHAGVGVRHGIRVPEGGGPLTLLAAVAPNEDRPDETVENPESGRGTVAPGGPRA
jgi:quercetin dioxygenase-like cupin family protein